MNNYDGENFFIFIIRFFIVRMSDVLSFCNLTVSAFFLREYK